MLEIMARMQTESERFKGKQETKDCKTSEVEQMFCFFGGVSL